MNEKAMGLQAFCHDLMGLMPQLMRGFVSYEHRSLVSGAITPVQFWGLDHLLSRGACPMKDLASYLGISKPSATALIDRLITQGLVVRQEDEGDRRIVRIALSSRGRTLTQNIRQRRYRTLGRVFGRISERDRNEYLRLLKEIGSVMRELNDKGDVR